MKQIFHLGIITLLLLSINGCGYKTDPVYNEQRTMNSEQFIHSTSLNPEPLTLNPNFQRKLFV
jgi:hypothetical protein